MADGGWKPGTGQKIERLYAWVCTEPDGGEGVIGMTLPNGMMVPLVGADTERMDSYRGYAEDVARITGLPISLVEYSGREVKEAF